MTFSSSHPVKIAETVDAAPFTETDLDAVATADGGGELVFEDDTDDCIGAIEDEEITRGVEGMSGIIDVDTGGVAACVGNVATLEAAELELASVEIASRPEHGAELMRFWCIRFQAIRPRRSNTSRLAIIPSSSSRCE